MTDALIRFQAWVTAMRFVRRDRGASLVEYALLVALIAIVCLVAVDFLGGSTRDDVSESGSSMFVP